MKNILIEFLKLFFKPKRNLPKPNNLISQFGNSLNVLVVRQHNQLGDMLLSVPLFRAIKEITENVNLVVIASLDNVDAITSNQYVDEVILFDKKKLFNPLDAIRFLKKLRHRKFQLGIVPATVSISVTSCLLCKLAKCEFTVGPKSLNGKQNPASFLFDYSFELNFLNDSRHISNKILDIVRPLGIDTTNIEGHIKIDTENRKVAESYLSKNDKIKIGLHIGAGKIPNRWDLSHFRDLINRLVDKYDAEIYLTVGPWDEELLKELYPQIKTIPIILRKLSIPNLAAIIDSLDLFISNDTGIMHVAGATKCPLIALFGPTEPEVWAPVGKNKVYIRKSDDINSIQVDDVMKLVNEFLQ